jgi:chromosome segregation ATPase
MQVELIAKQAQLRDAQAHLQRCEQDVESADDVLHSIAFSLQECQDTLEAHKHRACSSST